MAQAEAHIEVREVTMAYGSFVIQRDLTFDINRGDIFVIMGGSGCGKSTLLKHMLGLIHPAKGDILYNGESFSRATPKRQEEMRQRWGITYQSGGLFSAMTLAQNVTLPLQLYTSYSSADIEDIVAYKLALVGLAGYQEFYPSEISGGMRKRAALAPGHRPGPGNPVLRRTLCGPGSHKLSPAGRIDRATAGIHWRYRGHGHPRVAQHLRHRYQFGLPGCQHPYHDRLRQPGRPARPQ